MSASLKELADILAVHGELQCHPMIEYERERDGTWDWHLKLRVLNDTAQDLGALPSNERSNLYYDLDYLCGVAQIRQFATRYAIDSERLKMLLPMKKMASP